jgi:hypothetical protein
MKNRVARLMSFGMALAAVVAVHAQDKTITANVPFSFYMSSTLMPEGAYRVDKLSLGVTRIRAMRSGAMKAVTTIHVVGKKQSEPARLVFHRYGDNYFLAEIWSGDASAGQALARSAREKELARGATGMHLAMVQVYLNR